MVVFDILGKEINIGDEVIFSSSGYSYRGKILKETKKSLALDIYGTYKNDWMGLIWWIRKASRPFNNMYKI